MGTVTAIHAQLAVEGLDGPCTVFYLQASEGMNALTRARARVLVYSQLSTATRLVGAAAVLALIDPEEGMERQLPLVVAGVEVIREWPDRVDLAFDLAPVEASLTQRGGYRMFVEKTTLEIIEAIWQGAGLRETIRELRWAKDYPVRPQCVQYDETDWEFLTRLLADDGIAFWFEARRGKPVLVLADSESSPVGLEFDARVQFVERSQMVAGRHIAELEMDEMLVSGRLHLREDNVRQPNLSIEGRADCSSRKAQHSLVTHGEQFEYPARVESLSEATVRAAVRLEQLTRHACVVRGKSDLVRLQPGRLLEIEGDVDEPFLGRFLVTEVEHELIAPEAADSLTMSGRPANESSPSAAGYSNRFKLVPASTLYRPARPLWPDLATVEPGTVTGSEGEEIHVNDLGEVKLKMPWDRSDIVDDRSSFWARSLQWCVGGGMMLPRVGWEVPVMYRNGDPDRPCVLGRLYNAATPLPFSLPAGAASSSLESATTPGGGAVNGIRLCDKKGKEALGVSASGSQSVVVGGAATTTVTGNESHDVGLSYAIDAASQMLTVGGEQSVNVVNNYSVAVQASRVESIGGSEKQSVNGDRTVATGAYTECVGASQATQCIQSMLQTGGNLLHQVGGALLQTAAAGISETVSGARQHIVGAARAVNCSVYSEKAAAKGIVAGPSELVASAECATNCAGGSIKAASVAATASGTITFEATSINLVASSVVTAGGIIGGGAVDVKGGNLKGEIKRSGDTRVGS